ncbi:fumarylpyruvate hydrolase [Cohaesibacter sp. ES.047]|uniref:fumarylacetoacetate hydrolase family protein n=1 Tax=Cohaesibacter sp. ES.047 TaxID=1798205 RepID=UPI000BB97A63|nr:fumarylacetoacetate hydrolase family protein [Cohaesibacter sp. ES.047]SNY91126.1 fumarylpyruvate hydrolase [Cohaesibacter sp. ES.047]
MNNKKTDPIYAITQPAVPTLPITGSETVFPIRRVYCVGRNYAAHAIEMGHDPDRELPFFFQKNPDNILYGKDFPYPPLSKDVHFEVELFVTLKAGGCDIPVDAANSLIFGYGVGVDFTRRDLQAQAKKQGRPWAAAKAFEASAPASAIVPADMIPTLAKKRIWLEKNGAVQQDSDLDHLIWAVPEVISELSKQFELAAGDVIFTGTPAGVGSVDVGDSIHCAVEDIADLSFKVV